MTTAYYESDRTGSCIWRMSTCSSSQFLWRDERRSLSENTFVADELNDLIPTRNSDVLDIIEMRPCNELRSTQSVSKVDRHVSALYGVVARTRIVIAPNMQRMKRPAPGYLAQDPCYLDRNGLPDDSEIGL
jgi:hypothetical protein